MALEGADRDVAVADLGNDEVVGVERAVRALDLARKQRRRRDGPRIRSDRQQPLERVLARDGGAVEEPEPVGGPGFDALSRAK